MDEKIDTVLNENSGLRAEVARLKDKIVALQRGGGQTSKPSGGIYTGPLCAKCHKRRMGRAFWWASAFTGMFLALLAWVLGLETQGQQWVEQYNATLRWCFKEGAFGLQVGLQRIGAHPKAMLFMAAVAGAMIAVPCFVTWMGWQWKLARHGVPSRLGWLYGAWRAAWRAIWRFFGDIWTSYRMTRTARS